MPLFKSSVQDIYTNLFLLSISQNCNFEKLVNETAMETNLYFKSKSESSFPIGFEGLYFVNYLVQKMNCSLSDIDDYFIFRKEELIEQLLETIDPIHKVYEVKFADLGNGHVTFQGNIALSELSGRYSMKSHIRHLKSIDYKYRARNDVTYTFSFSKYPDIDNPSKFVYKMEVLDLDVLKYGFYIYNHFTLWEETRGPLADFINKAILNKQIENQVSSNDSSSIEYTSTINISLRPINVISKIEKSNVELVSGVGNDTSTVRLMDKFCGYNDGEQYQRLVINSYLYPQDDTKEKVGINLVIEKGPKYNAIGNITFTEFKSGNDIALKKYVFSQFTDDIIKRYLDTDQYYIFDKPYLLRAQNSHNRTGYGWKRKGDFFSKSSSIFGYSGTQYGETGQYYIVGAYITSRYSYNQLNRVPFHILSDLTNLPETKNWSVPLSVYRGCINEITSDSVISTYLSVKTETRMEIIPVMFNDVEKCFYISIIDWIKYKDIILSDKFRISLG